MRLTSTKPPIARAVHPNAGVTAWYRDKLLALVDEMSASAVYWLTARYKEFPPDVMALDALPSNAMQKELTKLVTQWQKRFNAVSKEIAQGFAKKSVGAYQSAFKQALKDAGMVVEFRNTPAMQDAVNAVVKANINLIKSIPRQYFTQVQGSVMRSYSAGRDLSIAVKEIRKHTGVAQRRASFIARDQNNKLTAEATRVRRLELGITEAKWIHSGGGKHPRPEHVAADGKVFDVAKGMYFKSTGKWTQPGEEPNCRCVSRSVLPIL